MMRPTVRQRTVEPRRPRPDPITEPDATCVVDSAKPSALEARIVAAVDDSGREALRRLDIGEPLAERADDAPAAHVGAERDRDAARRGSPTVCGSVAAVCQPAVISASVMTPIVFCASFVPWASATSDDVKI